MGQSENFHRIIVPKSLVPGLEDKTDTSLGIAPSLSSSGLRAFGILGGNTTGLGGIVQF